MIRPFWTLRSRMSWSTLDAFIEELPEQAAAVRDKLRGGDGTYCLRTENRTLFLQLQDGNLSILDSVPGEADCTVEASEQQLLELLNGKGSPLKMLMLGQIRVKGDRLRLMKLAALA